jgi:predicted N-acetyltransferase YhbS
MTLTLRAYEAADSDAINRVAGAAFVQFEHEYDDWDAFLAGVTRMADLAATGELIVAEQDGEIVGGVVFVGPGVEKNQIFPPAWAIIRMLVVAPTARGHGIGRQLVAACLRAARCRACAGPAHQPDHGSRSAAVHGNWIHARRRVAAH